MPAVSCYELSWDGGNAFVCWSGLPSTGVNTDPDAFEPTELAPSVELDPCFAKQLGVVDRHTLRVRRCAPLSNPSRGAGAADEEAEEAVAPFPVLCTTANVTPVDVNDWEIVELNAERIERLMLSQVSRSPAPPLPRSASPLPSCFLVSHSCDRFTHPFCARFALFALSPLLAWSLALCLGVCVPVDTCRAKAVGIAGLGAPALPRGLGFRDGHGAPCVRVCRVAHYCHHRRHPSCMSLGLPAGPGALAGAGVPHLDP